MTLGDWQACAAEDLAARGCFEPESDVEWLLCEATGLTRSSLRFHRGDPLTDGQLERLNGWVRRRGQGEPLQYVLGYTEFMGLRLRTDCRALIPRFDTEILVDEALKTLAGWHPLRALDLCTGSGAIGLTLARRRPDASVTLSDVSRDALSLAEENAHDLKIGNVAFRQGDLFDPVEGELFDAILCNPPYLDTRDMENLQKEVRHEPDLALFGGTDGLDFYRRIAREASGHLEPGGWLFLEVGQGQARSVISLLGPEWTQADAIRDLSGTERVVRARLSPEKYDIPE
ncbi:MAG: peptide chain release factor N(5)-glutamine methyltransferase [Clostridia bacterium]|nr:peptide chain release factor N(5)-glutamine methyltransferase [Clostridia bacterium]